MNLAQLVNLTPHPIVMYAAGVDDTIAAGTVEPLRVIERDDRGPARLAFATAEIGLLAAGSRGVPVWSIQYRPGSIVALPEPGDGVGYIVSLPVALAAHDRDDLYVPFREVRNISGTVIGCRALARPTTEQLHDAA